MKPFIKYGFVIFGTFLIDFLSKKSLLNFLSEKYGNMVYDHTAICADCKIEGIFVPWQYIIGGDYGISNLFNIQFVWNTGTSFSVFKKLGAMMPVFLVFVTGIILAWLLYYFIKRSSRYEQLPLAFIIGGAFGNLIDRIRFGAVVDFLQWHIGGFWYFPAVFNIADVFISFGVVLYAFKFFINRHHCWIKK